MKRVDTVSIVAGGWSASLVDKGNLPGLVIGVNESAVLVTCDIALSMDRLWTEARWAHLEERNAPAYIRLLALQNKPQRPDWLYVFDNDIHQTRLSETPDILNGGNSGFCALNLAYTMRPRRIFLIGFDMSRGPNGEPYWHAPYPWARSGGATKPGHFARWIEQFTPAAAQCAEAGIEVLNVTTNSALTVFKRIQPKELHGL